MRKLSLILLLLVVLFTAGCSSPLPMRTVEKVDLDRFMGDWYVIASIPTVFEKNIYNAIERYERLGPDKIQTIFSYYKQGGDGKKHEMRPVGFVEDDGSNAIWGMQFIWPFKADYRVVYLDDQYRVTVIGREKRDYVWIMAREPGINDEEYLRIVAHVKSLGYDISQLKTVPQKW